MKYRRGTEEELNRGEHVAVPWEDGVVLKCPCGKRDVYVAEPPHEIKFDENGTLTLVGSCGYKENKAHERPQNWCHFSIKDGNVETHMDSQCPGSKL